MDKEKNRIALDGISLHLLEALRLCTHLDLSGLVPLEQRECRERITIFKNALDFTKDSVEKLSVLIA
jgi:hypothetical protein